MRVEQNESGDNSTNSNHMLINQLKEITGIQDQHILQKALNTSRGDIGHAVGLLTSQPPEVQDPGELHDAEPNGEVWEGQKDLPKDDLQAAIELSLQESHSAQVEERELNRALEASAEENTSKVKRKRCEAQGEFCSPSDWVRQEDCPVGIRNVGNTCWFSAVIQSLFHLPVFRRLVLSYCLSERLLEKCKSHSDKRNIAFMQELRCLFALMVASTRKFVDPSAAVELLRDAFRTSEAQQDVSEFTHKLLDWLEDAFQLAANGKSAEDKQENPMVQLFYGTFVTERKHEGKTLNSIEQFGQYPLQVNGFNNLDECLEGAMVEGEIECLHSEQTIPSGQERWFSKLPPVLTFELSRFEFNAQLGRPEKIHKKLEFPQVIYMDRYLHKNIEQTHGRRGEVKRLKEQLAVLQQKLECYKNYGSGPTKYPLADMLQFVLEFATTKPTAASPAEDIRSSASSPTPPGQNAEHSSENSSQAKPGDAGPSEGSVSGSQQPPSGQRTPVYKPFTQSRPPMDHNPHPAPHSITEEELHSVTTCLQRWRTEVENDITELKASIDRVSQALEGMYSDNSLCQVPYRLHAVLVHEGQASAGHYWAYIYDHANHRWMKYNDITITESSWEELERDSYGGMTNASAYCLMYINDKLPNLIAEDTDDETGQVLRGIDSLPPVLRRYVHEDNRWFRQELSEWEEQFCQPASAQDEPVEAPVVPAPTSPSPAPPTTQQTPAEQAPQPATPTEQPEQGPEPEADEELVPEPEQEPEERSQSRLQPPDPQASESAGCGPGETDRAVTDTPGTGQNTTSSPPTPTPEEGQQRQAPSPDTPQAPSPDTPRAPSPDTPQAPSPDTPQASSPDTPQAPSPDTPQAPNPTAESSGQAEANVQVEADPELPEHRTAAEADPQVRGAQEEGRAAEAPETVPDLEDGEQEEAPVRRRRPQVENEVTEVDIPNVGRIMVRSDTDGYNEEMMLTPAMQGVIMAIAKSRQVFDKEGPEAGLIKAFHEEYSRLHELSQEQNTLQEDPRLQHALVYFFQNKAPNRIIERTLLEQFTDRNLSFDERAVSIMREARSKLRLIKPEDMDLDEYLQWQEDYRLFRTVFVYLLTGLEQYQHGKVREALNYLAHAYQINATLLRHGEKRGLEQSLIALYRRKCLTALNDSASQLFNGGEESEVEEGMAIMNEAVIPCLHLMSRDTGLAQEDHEAMENIRGHWCSCLGQDMDDALQVKLGEFLPRVLDCSAEMVVLKDPPKVRLNSPHDLCSRLAAVMESIHNTSIVIVK